MNNPFTAMTLNLRVAVEVDGINYWPYRFMTVLAMIAKHHPDFLATQEVTDRMLNDLDTSLQDYKSCGDGRDGDRHGERCSLFVRKDAWKIEHHETIWLSETPEVAGSMDPEEGFPRICTMAVVASLHNETRLFLANVHLAYRSEKALNQNITTLIQYLTKWKKKYPYPVVLLGDFNANPDNPIHARLKQYGLISPLDNKSGSARKYTFHNFLGGAGIETIDYIYYSPELAIMSFFVDQSMIGARYPSDHFPVVADFILK